MRLQELCVYKHVWTACTKLRGEWSQKAICPFSPGPNYGSDPKWWQTQKGWKGLQNIGFDLEGNGDDEEHVDNDEVDDKNDNDNDFDMNTKVNDNDNDDNDEHEGATWQTGLDFTVTGMAWLLGLR